VSSITLPNVNIVGAAATLWTTFLIVRVVPLRLRHSILQKIARVGP
jgi:hypothetical protein